MLDIEAIIVGFWYLISGRVSIMVAGRIASRLRHPRRAGE
jgi:hypothetical protein